MNKQLDLFAEPPKPPEFYWRICWDWDGPEIGGFCDVNPIIARRADGSGSIYCYGEQCRILEALPSDEWLVEIAMGEVWGKPWYKDGTRLILAKNDIWPPTRQLRRAP
jgi:hypothetical protein